MTETIRCHQCKWLRTDGPCDQWYHWCGLDEGAPPCDRNRRWHERAGNADMYSELDGTCDRAERRFPKLRTCPFCGGDARRDGGKTDEGEWFLVCCPNCRCAQTPRFKTPIEATNAWNRRYGR